MLSVILRAVDRGFQSWLLKLFFSLSDADEKRMDRMVISRMKRSESSFAGATSECRTSVDRP